LVLQIKDEFVRSRGVYGVLKITECLNKCGIDISHNTVSKLMQDNGLYSKVCKKFKAQTTDSDHDKPIYENMLNRKFTVPHENYAYVEDITYIHTAEGWLYLATVMDLYSNKIIGYATSPKIDKWLVVKALTNALKARCYPRGVIVHSDRGSQYCSKVYRSLIKQHGLIGSMSRKGNCWDNAVAENFFGLIKKECLNHTIFETRAMAELYVFDYINGWYNTVRIHSKLGYLSPDEFEAVNCKNGVVPFNSVKCVKIPNILHSLSCLVVQ
jgi:transposase InsO family protein